MINEYSECTLSYFTTCCVHNLWVYHMDILNLAQMADSCNLCKIQDSLHWLQLLALDLGCPDRNPRSGAFALSVSWQSLRHGGRGVHLLRCAVSSLDLFAKSLFVVRRSDLRSLHLQLFCLLEGDSLSHNNLWLSALTTCSLLFSSIF